MRILEGFDGLDARADAFRQRGAGRLADAVDGEDGRAIEARRKIRRSGMRQMVGHEMKSLPERTSKKLFDGTVHLTEPQPEGFLDPRIPTTRRDIAFGAASGSNDRRHDRYRAAVRPACFRQKRIARSGSWCGLSQFGLLGMLDAIEAFLLDGGDELAIDEQRSR